MSFEYSRSVTGVDLASSLSTRCFLLDDSLTSALCAQDAAILATNILMYKIHVSSAFYWVLQTMQLSDWLADSQPDMT